MTKRNEETHYEPYRTLAADSPRLSLSFRHGFRLARLGEPDGLAGIAVRRDRRGSFCIALGAKGTALCSEGQARYPPVYERRPLARRYIRSQAFAAKIRWQTAAAHQPPH